VRRECRFDVRRRQSPHATASRHAAGLLSWHFSGACCAASVGTRYFGNRAGPYLAGWDADPSSGPSQAACCQGWRACWERRDGFAARVEHSWHKQPCW
jgi:hypothetical protein